MSSSPVGGEIDLSYVMPCLNEAKTLPVCIEKAKASLAASGLRGEVIVADNGSTDGSQELARSLGARVVDVPEKGYGAALRGGIAAAGGRFLVMGDADDSYDWSRAHELVVPLREGRAGLVMGSRLRGGIRPGAMPWHHKWIGNPGLTLLVNLFCRAGISDSQCGMRAFTREAYERMKLRSAGMEFASEMILKGARNRVGIAEVPLVLHKDGRGRPPHLRSFRDGWRHLRYLLLATPLWLFLLPGITLLGAGLALAGLLVPFRIPVAGHVPDTNASVVGSLAALLGYQLVTLGLFTRVQHVLAGEPDPWGERFVAEFRLERGIRLGLTVLLLGLAGDLWLFSSWAGGGFGAIERWVSNLVILFSTLVVLGAQIVFSSFFVDVLRAGRPTDGAAGSR
jgi:hypothetical protein